MKKIFKNTDNECQSVSGDGNLLKLVNILDSAELDKCLEQEKELERYFDFLSKLSREELLAIVKYEVYNRVLK